MRVSWLRGGRPPTWRAWGSSKGAEGSRSRCGRDRWTTRTLLHARHPTPLALARIASLGLGTSTTGEGTERGGWATHVACRYSRTARPLVAASRTLPNQSEREASHKVESLGALLRELDRVKPKVDACLGLLNKTESSAVLVEKEERAAAPDLWEGSGQDGGQNGRQEAAQLLRDITKLRRNVTLATKLEDLFGDLVAAVDLLKLESVDAGPENEILAEAAGYLDEIQGLLGEWETVKLLDGPFDHCDACLSINAGAGGTDAQDWAQMLHRMYLRWAERRGYKVTPLELSEGEEAGIKSCSFQVQGDHAFGFLSCEKGTHRLVRQSPFNAKAARQTSFAGVEVVPVVEEDVVSAANIVVDDKDLQVTTMRSGGKGGQNVNKIESAVRMKHLPTGLSVKCSEERSQAMNKAKALVVLKSKLFVLERERKEAEMREVRGEQVKADFGQQVRNYVLHPYKLVKDLRTGHETPDVLRVLDGDIDDILVELLNYRAGAKAGDF